MPRNLQAGLQDLLSRGDVNIESHGTIDLVIQRDNVEVAYYLATAEILVNGVNYQNDLRRTGDIVSSITRAADRAEIQIQNVDTLFGIALFDIFEYLYTSEVKIGAYWKDLNSGAQYSHNFLTGVVIDSDIDENFVTLQVISDPYTDVSVGATRAFRRLCTAEFRRFDTCGYAGSKDTCNLRLNDADGCDGRHGATVKFAKFMGDAFLDPQASVANAIITTVLGNNRVVISRIPITEVSGGATGIPSSNPNVRTVDMDALQDFTADEGRLLPVAFGKHIVAGTLLAKKFTAGSPNTSKFIVGLGEGQGQGGGQGEWDSAVTVWYGGEALSASPDGSTDGYHFHPGTISTGVADAVQGVDSFITTGIAYSGTANIAVKLPSQFTTTDDPTRIRGLYQCKLVADYDGTGAEIDYLYSSNPALIAADRIRFYYVQRYKKDPERAAALFRRRINWMYWRAWRDYNQTTITWDDGTTSNRTIPRFECHLAFLDSINLADALDQICAQCGGTWQDDGQQINFFSPEFRDPIHHFNESNITVAPTAEPIDSRTRFNYFIGRFRDLDNDYLTPAQAEVKLQYLIDRVGERKSERQFGNMYHSQAQRLLRRQSRIESENPVVFSLTGDGSAIHVLQGDYVTISHPVLASEYQRCWVLDVTRLSGERTADEFQFQLQKIASPFFYSDSDHAPIQESLATT